MNAHFPSPTATALQFWRSIRRDLREARKNTKPRSKARALCDAQLQAATLAVLTLEAAQ